METANTKRCSACKETKALSDFHKGQNQCKVCHKQTRHRYNTSEKGRAFYRRRQWLARQSSDPAVRAMLKAHKYVNQAVRDGTLPKVGELSCVRCGETAECYHHHQGYEPPNHKRVIPLCTECHRKAHHPEQ